MENRFAMRDFAVISMALLSVIIVILMWVSFDRKWDRLVEIRNHLDRQEEQITRMSRTIDGLQTSGIPVTGDSERRPANAAPGGFRFPEGHHLHRQELVQRMPMYRAGGRLNDVFPLTVPKLTPLVSADVYQRAVESYILESLATRDPDTLDFVPLVAESWEQSEDGLTITFRLRRDVNFSDGSPLTARDVEFTFDWIMNPRVAAPRARSSLSRFEYARALDDFTVEFRLSEFFFMGFETAAGLGILSEAFYSQFSEDEFNQSMGLLFGSGPYRLATDPVAWRPGRQRIEIVRNERYWGPRPTFDRIVWQEILEETARSIAFTNEQTDVHTPSPREFARTRDSEEIRQIANVFEFDTPTGGYRYIGWNQRRGDQPTVFADRRVRQAMTMLIDREEMGERLLFGLATVASGPFHFLSPQHNPEIRPWPYDVERAQELLREAGFELNDRRVLVNRETGQPFRFSLNLGSGNPVAEEMAFFVRDALARAGINMAIDLLEWGTLLQRINERNFDAIMLGWSGVIESDPYQIFHSNQIGDGGDNAVGYSNPVLDELIDRARATVDRDARTELWHKVHAVLHEDQPYTFLHNGRATAFVNNRLHNVTRTRTGLTPRLEWFVPAMEP